MLNVGETHLPMQAHSRKQLAKWGWWSTHVGKMVGDAQPKGKLIGCSNHKRIFSNKKQHAKDGENLKINVSKMYITLTIRSRFLTNHVITNGRLPWVLDPNLINIRQRG